MISNCVKELHVIAVIYSYYTTVTNNQIAWFELFNNYDFFLLLDQKHSRAAATFGFIPVLSHWLIFSSKRIFCCKHSLISAWIDLQKCHDIPDQQKNCSKDRLPFYLLTFISLLSCFVCSSSSAASSVFFLLLSSCLLYLSFIPPVLIVCLFSCLFYRVDSSLSLFVSLSRSISPSYPVNPASPCSVF